MSAVFITEELGADRSWSPFFEPIEEKIHSVLEAVSDSDMVPKREEIFAAFAAPLQASKVLIIGQDPYPTLGHAHGRAFSVPSHVQPLPKSLKNIFREYSSDLKLSEPTSGDLSKWSEQGVILMNRVFTTRVGQSNAHIRNGWQEISGYISEELGRSGVVGILWGNQAQEVAGHFQRCLSAPHPSPLSAYKGFFGSQPFSRCNALLEANSIAPIDWTL